MKLFLIIRFQRMCCKQKGNNSSRQITTNSLPNIFNKYRLRMWTHVQTSHRLLSHRILQWADRMVSIKNYDPPTLSDLTLIIVQPLLSGSSLYWSPLLDTLLPIIFTIELTSSRCLFLFSGNIDPLVLIECKISKNGWSL